MERVLEPELMTDVAQARDYANSDFSEPHNAFVRRFQSCFPDFKAGLIADLGCGPADVTMRMAKAYPMVSFVGMDGSAAMLQFGQEAIQREGLEDRIKLINRWLPDHGYTKPKFDAVISNSLLHQLHQPMNLWRTVRELAKVGAPIFIMDLTRPSSPEKAQKLVDQHATGAPELMRRDFYNSLLAAFRPDEVTGQLQEAGLDNLQVEEISDRHMIIHGARI